MRKGCELMGAFVPGMGRVEVLGSKVNAEHGKLSWSHLTFTPRLPLLWQRVFFVPFFLEANRIAALLDGRGFLVALVRMVPRSGLTQTFSLWPPYLYPLRTMRSHTLQSDWSVRHCPSLGGLDITMHHCVHQHGLVDAEGGLDITFPLLTCLCVWFWGVAIQGHGASHDLQTSFVFPLSFDLYVPLQPSCLFHPSRNICRTFSVPLHPFRVL